MTDTHQSDTDQAEVDSTDHADADTPDTVDADQPGADTTDRGDADQPDADTTAPLQTNTFSLIGFAFSLNPALALVGIPLCYVALVQIRRTGERGRRLALAGLWIGYLLLAAAIVGVSVAAVSLPGLWPRAAGDLSRLEWCRTVDSSRPGLDYLANIDTTAPTQADLDQLGVSSSDASRLAASAPVGTVAQEASDQLVAALDTAVATVDAADLSGAASQTAFSGVTAAAGYLVWEADHTVCVQ